MGMKEILSALDAAFCLKDSLGMQYLIIINNNNNNNNNNRIFPQDNPSVQSTVINGVLLRIKN